MSSLLPGLFITAFFLTMCASPGQENSTFPTDKILVAWVKISDKLEWGGALISLGDGFRYDAIHISEEAGLHCEMGHESNRKGSEVSAEDVDFPKGKWAQLAAVYSGKTVKLYQGRERVLEYELDTVDLLSSENQYVFFGAESP